ncbi:MAG TPA: hypothetical protein VHV57_02880 [Acidimicrobiales bacterium]|nr:hypothetical protein [Acidimicrobiales bacterium]
MPVVDPQLMAKVFAGFVKELPELEELSGRVRVGGNAASFMSFCAHLAEETDSTGYWNWVIPEVEFGEIFEFLTSQPVQEASSEAISNAALVLHAIQPDWSGEPLLAHTVQQFKRVDLDDQNDVRRSLDVIDTFWPNGRIALSAVANFGELSRVILLAIRKGDKRNVGRLLWLQLQLGPALSDLLQQTPRTEEAIQGIRRVLADSSQYLEAIESQCEYVKRDGLEAIDHLAESDDLIRQWSDALILICKRTNS